MPVVFVCRGDNRRGRGAARVVPRRKVLRRANENFILIYRPLGTNCGTEINDFKSVE
jgi:hypothetical protein